MAIKVRALDLRVLNMRTRMPFRYGIASMTALPHLFVRAEVEVDGRSQAGLASEGLPPKWFTKDPHTTFRQDLADMLRVIRHASELALEQPPASSFYDWWRPLYDRQLAWGEAAGFPPLLAGLGASLVERAAIDALCRARQLPFAAAVRRNAFGIRLEELHPELAGQQPADLLPAAPLRRVIARHTVGLADPLTDADVPPRERLEDGLPQSLEACIRAYGLTHFKLKITGRPEADLPRLRQIADVIQRAAGHAGEDYACTLDGNEQFHDVPAFQDFWKRLGGDERLRGLMRHLLFVEQPLHRDVALDEDACRDLAQWIDGPPIIIDESDGGLDSLPRAFRGGYAGTSHKNCKGVLKGIANACLLARRQQDQPRWRYVLSGEDLANVGPVALLQDLAAMATLGIQHVERNGHHYFAGLSMLPPAAQAQVLASHGDLYRRHERGFPTLDVRDGAIQVGSVVDAPFGTGFLLDTSPFTPLAEWRFDTLGVTE